MTANLVVFDLDGTLTRTATVDGYCFAEAVRDVLSVAFDESFETFAEHTDAAILREIHSARSSERYEVIADRVHARFLERLRAAFGSDPSTCRAVAGAEGVFEAVREAGWTPAIATGAWRESARLKLTTAGIPTEGVPLASSSDHDRRSDIIRRAMVLAADGADVGDIVYVGDGPWDVRACSELGIGFVGRCDPSAEGALRTLGADAIVPDFVDVGAFLAHLSDPSSLQPRPRR